MSIDIYTGIDRHVSGPVVGADYGVESTMRIPHPKGYLCPRAAIAPNINGDLSKEFWKNAPWSDDFGDIEGDVKPRPTWRTRMKMLWDDNHLYIAAELTEPNVWATITQHDAVIFQDNDFEVFIDPDGDNHEYYELELNALNTTWDLRLVKPYRDGGPALNEWEIEGMQTAVKVDGVLNDASVTDRGWTVEIALPWKALGEYAKVASPPSPGDKWRINFSRVEWDVTTQGKVTTKVPNRPEHNWVWSPQHAVDMHRPELWGYVEFSSSARPRNRKVVDRDWETKCLLMDVYHAQKKHMGEKKRWAKSLGELGMRARGLRLQMKPSAGGWTASKSGWRIHEDSLFTSV